MSDHASVIIFKVLVLGDANTGKTSIIKRYVHNMFSGAYKTTVGVDFHLKTIMAGDPPRQVKLQLWDIAGQDRFGAISRVYYKDALGALLVFDVTNKASYDSTFQWKEEIHSKVLLPNGHPIPIILLGNKCDLDYDHIIDLKEIENTINEAKRAHLENPSSVAPAVSGFYVTSAKTGENIEKACTAMVDSILAFDDIFKKKPVDPGLVNPSVRSKAPEKQGGCC